MANVAFSYTGAIQTYTVPSGVAVIDVTANGAAGETSTYPGGYGAQVTASIPVTSGHVLNIYVGGQSGVYGGGESVYGGEYGGDGTFVVDATTGTLLLAVGGGGAGASTGPGGGAGQVGYAGSGSYAGGGATTSAGGSSDYSSGAGPASFSGSTLAVGRGGAGVYGGAGGGYYGGGGGGYEYTTSYQYISGYSTTDTLTSTDTTSYTNLVNPTYPGQSYYTSDAEAGTWLSVPPAPSGSPPTSWSYVFWSYQGPGTDTGDYDYWLYGYTVSYTAIYSTAYQTNYDPGAGGGGSSYVTPAATNVSYMAAANTGLGSFEIVPPSAPDAATLVSPIGDVAIDVSSGTPFRAVYTSTDGAPANGFVAQIEVAGAAVGYFDAATGSISTSQVINACWVAPGATPTFSIPAGVLTDGNSYDWAVAFQESYANLLGPLSANATFIARAAPVVTIVSPTGTTAVTVGSIQATAAPAPGVSLTAWRCLVYLQSTIGTTGFVWGQSAGLVWDSGTVSGVLPAAIIPQTLSPSPVYEAAVQVTQTGSQNSEWTPTGPFMFRIVFAISGTLSAASSFSERLASVNWAKGQINSLGSLIPAVVTSTVFTSFTLVDSLHFATQQSQPVQLIPNDTFGDVAHYSTYSFPPLSSATNGDFTTVGNVVASYVPETGSVLVTQGAVPAIGAVHSSIRILSAPVLAEGGTSIAAGSSGGFVSPSFTPSAAGQLYVATRFVALDSFTADLQILDATTNEVLISWPLTGAAGQIVQAYRPYVIGSLVPASTPLQVALVVSGSDNAWVMQALSVFDEGLVWSFSVDAGDTWTSAYGVRNQPTGVVRFASPGTQLTWKASFYRGGLYVNALRIRPRYVRSQPLPPPQAMRGPSVTFNDTTASILTDPMFDQSFVPIPETWFVGSAVSSTPSV